VYNMRSLSVSSMNIDDRRPTSGPIHTFWTSNGHNSATRQPIPFMFGSRVAFSGDRTAPFPIGSNPRWRLVAILKKNSNGYIPAPSGVQGQSLW